LLERVSWRLAEYNTVRLSSSLLSWMCLRLCRAGNLPMCTYLLLLMHSGFIGKLFWFYADLVGALGAYWLICIPVFIIAPTADYWFQCWFLLSALQPLFETVFLIFALKVLVQRSLPTFWFTTHSICCKSIFFLILILMYIKAVGCHCIWHSINPLLH